jgi:hypothetical protein
MHVEFTTVSIRTARIGYPAALAKRPSDGSSVLSEVYRRPTFRDGLIVRYQDYSNPLIGILAFGGTISFSNSEA